MINSSGAVQQYRYDAAGRLAQVLNGSGGVMATYSYGASNQRLMSVEGAVTTYYGWDGGRVIAEYAPSGASGLLWQTGYVYLGGRLLATMNGAAGSGTRFHHPDRLGTNVVTDQSNGELVTKQMGMPFGTQQPMGAFGGDNSWQHPSKGNPSKKRFTSYDRSDATGLDYAVNRFYSAAQGRFTQVDPIGMSAASLSDPQSLNMYSYCGNDPINHVDPDGLFFKKLFGWIGKAFKFLFKVAAIALFVVAMVLLPGAIAGFVAWKGWFILMGLAGAAGLAGWHNGKLGTIAGTLLTAGLGWKGNARTPNTFPKGIGVGGVSNFVAGAVDEEIEWRAILGLKYWLGTSIKDGIEYAGVICRKANGALYSIIKPGTKTSSYATCLPGAQVVAGWHTHPQKGGDLVDPKDPKKGRFSEKEGFSDSDKMAANLRGVPEYVAERSGRIYRFDPAFGPGTAIISPNPDLLRGNTVLLSATAPVTPVTDMRQIIR